MIKDRCDKLAEQIFDDYKGKEVSIVVILTGAFQFFSDLNESIMKVRAIRRPETDEEDVIVQYYMRKVSSYRNTESLGKDNVKVDISVEECQGKNVLIVEDIYDTGASMDSILESVRDKGALDVKVCVLLHKKNVLNLEYKYYADYIGFFMPMKFVIGYGMDLNEYVRDMRHICSISKAGIQKYIV